jgi:Ion channel regulatory protein UNC-93
VDGCSFQTQGTRWFLIFAGAVLGVSAALLWSAQGSIMMSYPLEKDKGKAFGVFWAIFQFGSLIGSLIALAINIRSGKLSAVSTSTYLVTQFAILNSHLHVLIPRLGIYHHYVLRHGFNYLYSTPQRDHTSGWHAREGRGVLVCTQ